MRGTCNRWLDFMGELFLISLQQGVVWNLAAHKIISSSPSCLWCSSDLWSLRTLCHSIFGKGAVDECTCSGHCRCMFGQNTFWGFPVPHLEEDTKPWVRPCVFSAISVFPVTRNRHEDLQYKDDDPLWHLINWGMMMINSKHCLQSSSQFKGCMLHWAHRS